MESPPLLSILIPAFNYPEGLQRILSRLVPVASDVEVIIFDDSEVSLEPIVNTFAGKIKRLRFRHNPSSFGAPLGAGRNWNSLIDSAQGEYFILLHHDEIFLDENPLDFIISIIGTLPADIYIMSLLLLNEDLTIRRPHTPNFLRNFIVKHVPGYMYRRNVIGPTASLIIRRNIAPRFDHRLRWLIDVDFYVRLFTQKVNFIGVQSLCIGSIIRKKGSITLSLADRVKQIDRNERRLISERALKKEAWLNCWNNIFIKSTESFFWVGLKAGWLSIFHLTKILRGTK